MSDYPKLQWSQFQGTDKNEQIVIRSDDVDEFNGLLDIYKIKVATPVKQTTDVMEGQKCRKCGAKMVLNPKTNKWFCSAKCWLNTSKIDSVNF